ncbi:hypothetical protein ABT071_22120 [Streptomyces sp. NPDC002506]|uniref:hypothetical protein n=1 Tax=Streptomyces sp. NPDC002506 TaxID=3154536 RepID=UPI00332A7EBD
MPEEITAVTPSNFTFDLGGIAVKGVTKVDSPTLDEQEPVKQEYRTSAGLDNHVIDYSDTKAKIGGTFSVTVLAQANCPFAAWVKTFKDGNGQKKEMTVTLRDGKDAQVFKFDATGCIPATTAPTHDGLDAGGTGVFTLTYKVRADEIKYT